jgi:hypothetical protein
MLPVPALAEARFRPSREGASGATGAGAARAAAAGASFPSVTIWRVVVPELVSAAVWPAASGDAAPGFNSILRGGSLSAAMAGRQKAMIAMLAKTVVHRDMGSLLWLGTIASISDIGSQTGNQRS